MSLDKIDHRNLVCLPRCFSHMRSKGQIYSDILKIDLFFIDIYCDSIKMYWPVNILLTILFGR